MKRLNDDRGRIGEVRAILKSNGTPPTHLIYDPNQYDKAKLERKGEWLMMKPVSTKFEIIHRVPVLTEANDLFRW